MEIKEHFEANMLDGESIKEWKVMLEAESILEYIQEFYNLKENQWYSPSETGK
jgi:hypothetical protein